MLHLFFTSSVPGFSFTSSAHLRSQFTVVFAEIIDVRRFQAICLTKLD